jgi:hypothetical protein
MEFKTGDIVEFGGVLGRVVSSDYNNVYPIWVDFNDYHTSFTLDGRYKLEHTKPLLVLIERPKKKVKKTIWFNIYKNKSHDFTTSWSHDSEQSALCCAEGSGGYLKTICTEVEED